MKIPVQLFYNINYQWFQYLIDYIIAIINRTLEPNRTLCKGSKNNPKLGLFLKNKDKIDTIILYRTLELDIHIQYIKNIYIYVLKRPKQ